MSDPATFNLFDEVNAPVVEVTVPAHHGLHEDFAYLAMKLIKHNGNYRPDGSDTSELQASMTVQGLLQPIAVRPIPGSDTQSLVRYEVIFGNRRFDAATALGWKEIPAFVKDYSDEEVQEARLVENIHRADVHPVHEADALVKLRQTGLSVGEIAAKIGKPPGYVYKRMSLCNLSPKVRKLYLDGRLAHATALDLAKVADPSMQEKAAAEIDRYDHSTREARAYIQRTCFLLLKKTAFSLKLAVEGVDAPACTECPKRTSATKAISLFDDADDLKDDHCLDAACFEAKVKKADKVFVAKVKADGHEILDAETVKKIFSYGSTLVGNCKFLKIDDLCPVDPKKRTYRRTLGKKHLPAKLALARVEDYTGKVDVWLATKTEIFAALTEMGLVKDAKDAKTKTNTKTDEKGQTAADRAKAKFQRAVSNVAIEECIKASSTLRIGATASSFLDLVVHALAARAPGQTATAKALGLESAWSIDAKYIEGLDDKQKTGLVMRQLLAMVGAEGGGHGDKYNETLRSAANFFEIDMTAIEKKIEAAVEEKKAKGKVTTEEKAQTAAKKKAAGKKLTKSETKAARKKTAKAATKKTTKKTAKKASTKKTTKKTTKKA